MMEGRSPEESGTWRRPSKSWKSGASSPDWVAENGKLLDNLRDAQTRARVVQDMQRTGSCDPARSVPRAIVGFTKPELKKYEGWRIDAIMHDMNKSAQDAVIDLILAENNHLGKINFSMTEENVLAIVAGNLPPYVVNPQVRWRVPLDA